MPHRGAALFEEHTAGISLLGDGRSLRLRPKAIMRDSMGFRHKKRARGSVEVAARGTCSRECQVPTLSNISPMNGDENSVLDTFVVALAT